MSEEQAILEAIDAERIAQGVSVAEMCARAGMSATTFYRWFSGGGSPHLTTVLLLCKALGLTLAVRKDKKS